MTKKNLEFHNVTEKEKEKIRKEVRSILEKFAGKLEKVSTKHTHFPSAENESGTREEGTPWKTEQDFHDITLLNAPFVEDESIIAEKGDWTK